MAASGNAQEMLRAAKLLEVFDDEQITQLADVMETTRHGPGSVIIRQGDAAHNAFFMLNAGECKVCVNIGDKEQEYRRYQPGSLFGEMACLKKAPYAANVIAVTDVEVVHTTIETFESLFGPLAELQQAKYIEDPRKVISNFFEKGDSRGPHGALRVRGLEPEPTTIGESSWFSVFRPTSRDAIAKMLSGQGIGKKANVQGRAARQGILSGYVPFMQISKNSDKPQVEVAPPTARTAIFYKSNEAREQAKQALEEVMHDHEFRLDFEHKSIGLIDDYCPTCFGVELPECVLREAYIMRQDIVPAEGFETGLPSDPFFMNMNLRVIGDTSAPKTVLYQVDGKDAMNATTLVLAYQGTCVKPMVETFDAFTVGSKGVNYEPLPDDQALMAAWAFDHASEICKAPDGNPWTVRWQQLLKDTPPQSPGMGDSVSARLFGDLINETSESGAFRGVGECWNYGLPQEFDDDYLVIWHGFTEKPWEYVTLAGLQQFLMDRIGESYVFPMNPVWPVRDAGWFRVFQALHASEAGKAALQQWFSPQEHLLDDILALGDSSRPSSL
mmetsp:Transcript_70645/g.133260  ORF Transcript_70645/g.133260 Transcript_70645/m.133260 type:complete len:556 (+) Transcript_70645:79-1746(+)